MSRVLADTSAYSAFLRGHAGVGEALRVADEIRITPIVLGELRAGHLRGRRRPENEEQLLLFLSSPRVGVLPVDEETAEGGVCGIEMALMDLAGKAYGVPTYVLAGGKFRDAVRMYCDTPNEPTGEAMGHKLKARLERGFTMLKMDVGIQPLIGVKDALTYPAGMLNIDDGTELDRMLDINSILHPYTHVRLTPKGIEMLCDYVEQVRAVIGYEVPIAADHFGHIGVDDCIRLGEALEPYNLAWLEDMVPWQFTDQWVQMERALKTPVCTGEDIYLKEGFMALLQAHGVNVIHPDLATSGGILETKKIGDLAQEYGVSMALRTPSGRA